MYPITNNIIKGLPQKPYRNGIGQYEGVVAHATAVYAPDENQVTYFKREWKNRKAFAHIFVDWDSIRKTAGLNYQAWAAGNGNPRFVHVELCQTKDPKRFEESYKRYVWVIAHILYQRKLGVKDGVTLVSHDWVSRNLGGTTHTDPLAYLRTWGKTWAEFVNDVAEEYGEMK